MKKFILILVCALSILSQSNILFCENEIEIDKIVNKGNLGVVEGFFKGKGTMVIIDEQERKIYRATDNQIIFDAENLKGRETIIVKSDKSKAEKDFEFVPAEVKPATHLKINYKWLDENRVSITIRDYESLGEINIFCLDNDSFILENKIYAPFTSNNLSEEFTIYTKMGKEILLKIIQEKNNKLYELDTKIPSYSTEVVDEDAKPEDERWRVNVSAGRAYFDDIIQKAWSYRVGVDYKLNETFYTGAYVRLIDGEYKIIENFAPKKDSVTLTGVGLRFGLEKDVLRNFEVDGSINVESLFGSKLEDGNELGVGVDVLLKYRVEEDVTFFIGTGIYWFDGFELEDQHDKSKTDKSFNIGFGFEIR